MKIKDYGVERTFRHLDNRGSEEEHAVPSYGVKSDSTMVVSKSGIGSYRKVPDSTAPGLDDYMEGC